MPNKNPFKIALEVRKGTLDEKVLKGASKRLFHDKSLTNEMLEGYSNPSKENRSRTLVQHHSTFNY